jgi:hypothetical protein
MAVQKIIFVSQYFCKQKFLNIFAKLDFFMISMQFISLLLCDLWFYLWFIDTPGIFNALKNCTLKIYEAQNFLRQHFGEKLFAHQKFPILFIYCMINKFKKGNSQFHLSQLHNHSMFMVYENERTKGWKLALPFWNLNFFEKVNFFKRKL